MCVFKHKIRNQFWRHRNHKKKLGARKTTGRHKSWRQAKQKTTNTIHKNPRLNTHQEMSAMPNTHSALLVSCQYTEAMHSALKNELLINESNLRSSELLKSLEIEGVSAQVIKMCVESADKAVLKQRAHSKASAHKILKGKSLATNLLTETAMSPIGKKNKHKKHKKDRKPRPLNAYHFFCQERLKLGKKMVTGDWQEQKDSSEGISKYVEMARQSSVDHIAKMLDAENETAVVDAEPVVIADVDEE